MEVYAAHAQLAHIRQISGVEGVQTVLRGNIKTRREAPDATTARPANTAVKRVLLLSLDVFFVHWVSTLRKKEQSQYPTAQIARRKRILLFWDQILLTRVLLARTVKPLATGQQAASMHALRDSTGRDRAARLALLGSTLRRRRQRVAMCVKTVCLASS